MLLMVYAKGQNARGCSRKEYVRDLWMLEILEVYNSWLEIIDQLFMGKCGVGGFRVVIEADRSMSRQFIPIHNTSTVHIPTRARTVRKAL